MVIYLDITSFVLNAMRP